MKNKGKLRKQGRAKKKEKQPISSKNGARKMIWGTILSIIAVFGFVVWFNPRISVSPSFSLNPQNALLTTFEIRNEGNTAINKVKFSISIREIKTSHGSQINGGLRLTEANNIVPVLRVNEKYTVIFPPNFKIGSDVTSADIAFVVRFTLPFLPFIPIEKMFRYVACKDVEGKFNWAAQPLSK